MKTKILGLLISLSLFGFCSSRADLAPGDYQLIEVSLSQNTSHEPYLYDVKIIEKEKGRLFMVFTKSRYTSNYLISKEIEILQAKNLVMFELRGKSKDALSACVYIGAAIDNSIVGDFTDIPYSETGRFRLVAKK